MQKKFQLRSFTYKLGLAGETLEISDKKDSIEDQVEICMNHYSNKIFIIITQYNKLGSMIESTAESNPLSLSKEILFESKTIFGSRDREIYEIYGRAIIELLNNEARVKKSILDKNPTAKVIGSPFANKSLLLSLALKPEEDEDKERALLKKILGSIAENLYEIA
mmetsp:Transcript_40905/g.47562  ORF Transcript_40905/g.47562 Transcript_40905/m.47562 type:complete len:165 (-) Transcript_40905:1193-1687(-)|eukprot:CAMPEP_0176438212 /NCGR_PEP_ID=MMETSP0127-20121128/19138_1 /TAXON_ID=938130 /ORGANISM="Platyophrya macrostoma, Strain WH" /LENGTH=164 /DNA_ID=CAMNT_0017822097 /DNA_START=18 /DNA_END=512 /DNA_ORIENTATION=-